MLNYTNKQYEQYLEYMKKMGNEQDIDKNFAVWVEFKDWQTEQGLSDDVIEEMGKKLEKEEG